MGRILLSTDTSLSRSQISSLNPMNKNIQKAILNFTGASRFEKIEVIQTLWSGYGEIARLRLYDAAIDTVVAKTVALPKAAEHPRGWNTERSHQRKIRSYQVECKWYTAFAAQCDASCRVPACLGALEDNDQFVMVLEDLDAAGFSGRLDYASDVSEQAMHLYVRACIDWLAHFHARFLQVKPQGLWAEGSYWHLATRPDEFAALPSDNLKRYAAAIDSQLSMCRWQTLIHGDAKLANFCFADAFFDSAGNRSVDDLVDEAPLVAAVDFQYVGAGCGMKDLAYFISSCYEEADCERLAPKLLDDYFCALRKALEQYNKGLSSHELDDLEQEWRALYPLAWTDFYRFLKGWSPAHWKLHTYSEKIARQTLSQLQKQPQALSAHLPALLHLAIQAAEAAGEVIAGSLNKVLTVMHKGLGASPVGDVLTEVDLQCQTLIAARLAPVCEQFGIAFVGEESDDHSARLLAEYAWLVDPIDGTLPFIEKREGYAVSIALINRAGEPLLGVVLDVHQQKIYAAAQGCELRLLGEEPSRYKEPSAGTYNDKKNQDQQIRCYLDASYQHDNRYPALLKQLHEYALANGFAGVVPLVGLGAALNACRVLDDKPAVYIKLPKEQGGSLWDYAASAAIFTQLGLPVSNIFGAPLDLNRKDSTYLNHQGVLYASDAALAAYVVAALA